MKGSKMQVFLVTSIDKTIKSNKKGEGDWRTGLKNWGSNSVPKTGSYTSGTLLEMLWTIFDKAADKLMSFRSGARLNSKIP